MKTEISSGGVIIKKFGSVWKVLLLRDMSDNWTFPKGLVETGETHEQTAVREIAEEVGLSGVRLVAPLKHIEYLYKRGGLIKKTVHYFLFEYRGDTTPVGQVREGIREVAWLTFSQAFKQAGYAQTNIPILKKAQVLARDIV